MGQYVATIRAWDPVGLEYLYWNVTQIGDPVSEEPGGYPDPSTLTDFVYTWADHPGYNISYGDVALDSSASPIDVPFVDIQANNIVLLMLKEIDGTLGLTPTITITPGVGFSIVGQGGDSSVYSWRII